MLYKFFLEDIVPEDEIAMRYYLEKLIGAQIVGYTFKNITTPWLECMEEVFSIIGFPPEYLTNILTLEYINDFIERNIPTIEQYIQDVRDELLDYSESEKREFMLKEIIGYSQEFNELTAKYPGITKAINDPQWIEWYSSISNKI